MQLQTLITGRAFLEGPRWHEGALWVSDMHADEVIRVSLDGTVEVIAHLPNQPSGLGWLPNGDLLVVSMTDRKLMRREASGALHVHADMSSVITHRANDMVVDAKGRAYIGNFGFDFDKGEAPATTVVLRVDADGGVSVAADDVSFPNGMVITPDGKTLILGETFARQLTAFDIQKNGELTNRRVWAALPEGAVPDGICLDEAGGVWAASPTTKDCIRLEEGGRVTDRISTGAQQAIACMLGGEAGRTLFILTAESTHRHICQETRTASILFTEVAHARAGRP